MIEKSAGPAVNFVAVVVDGPIGMKTYEEAESLAREVTQVMQNSGRCFRHHTRFIPSEEFHNNCPACYWEHEARAEAALREKLTPKR